MLDALERIPDDKIREMRAQVGANAHVLAYGADGTWAGGAVERLLQTLTAQAQHRGDLPSGWLFP